jgi:hypothetical protein
MSWNGQIMTLKKAVLSLLIFVIGFSSCTTDKNESVPISDEPLVEPFREHYQELMEEAKLWRKDAYLESAEFNFEANDMTIYAAFQSPSDDYESLLVVYDPKTNIISKEVFTQESPILFHVPIEESDWKLDSVEAINSFLSFEDIQKIWEPSSQQCNYLKLRHFYVNEQWVLAWVLTIADCLSLGKYYFFYLDPISGERLELKY